MKFSEMGLSASTLWALEKKGFETPSPIQAACIPLLLSGTKDIIWQAQTGTGKTAAFAIPVIEKIDTSKKHIQAVVIAPTRELAIQVSKEIASLSGTKRISVVQVYGWSPMWKQLKELRNGPQIVVGTPGRMIDMINRGKLKLGKIDFCILDEADEMLNMGFLDDIEEILDACNEERQMLCFSATMPSAIKRVATRYMGDYELVKVASQQLTTGNTEQLSMHLRQSDKGEALTRVIDSQPDFYGIVFCKTKRGCDDLVQNLQSNGYRADALHGDLNQGQREKVLQKFKNKRITLLIATDVAARGIDVDDLTHVVNYDLPQDAECYTHRIGRTGRAGKKGTALTFVTKKDEWKMKRIARTTKAEVKRMEIPSIESVIDQKKGHIVDKIQSEIPKEDQETYDEMIEKLLAAGTEKEIISSLLKIAFGKQLNVSGYKEISSNWSYSEKNPGMTRLFIARGKNDGLPGPRELVEWLQDETNVPQKLMDDVRIRDDFSFITCPKEEAQIILDVFAAKPGRTLVSISKDSDKRDWRRHGGWGRSRHWWGGDRGWRSGGWRKWWDRKRDKKFGKKDSGGKKGWRSGEKKDKHDKKGKKKDYKSKNKDEMKFNFSKSK